MDCDVLIVGAGPTGLVLALWLTRLGAKVRIVDKTTGPGTTSRALGVQARTLELYRQLDLAEPIVERAQAVSAVNLWARGRRKARIPFGEVGLAQTPFPSLHIFPQDEHERLLLARLEAEGVLVERQTEVVSFTEREDRVDARLRDALHGEEACEARYIAGCDGAHSIVRETIRAKFPGGTYQHVFYVADVDAAGPPIDGELHIDLDEADFLAIFPLKGQGRARLVGTVRDQRALRPDELRFEDVSDRAIQNLKLKVGKPNWFSTYRVHHRVADRFRRGRAFLLGDAAHIHSPAGGQGMNTGIGDAINLAWKLKAVLDGKATDALLDSYESERIAFARQLVQTTDRVFTFATAEGALADFVRLKLAPAILSRAFRYETVRDFAFRTVSQISVNYRRSPLSEGKAGRVHGGDRLPWVKADGLENHETLSAMAWQVHVYGGVGAELSQWCADRGLPLRHLPWTPRHGEAGIAQNAVYLIRPDTYVGLAEESGSIERLERYFTGRGLLIASSS
jgi:2-polyprenyl-6-methoxyphenol hydroxylase-like FAD-dependent oxidoreductase